MANLNTALRYLPNATANTNLHEIHLTDRQDNAVFAAGVAKDLQELSRQIPASESKPGFFTGGKGMIGLLGEYGLIAYGLRQSQSILREDRSPSYWSHSFLLAQDLPVDPAHIRSPKKSPFLWESTFEPAGMFNRFVDRNGVAPRRFSDYAPADFDMYQPHSVPNMAFIAIAMTPQERDAILDRANDPAVDQLRYDMLGLLGTWYAYLTNLAETPNPIAQGQPIYCSAYVQLAYDAARIDLSPGAHQRNTSPEHLWQMSKYLNSMLTFTDPKTMKTEIRPVHAWYCVRDRACVIAPIPARRNKSEMDPARSPDFMSLRKMRDIMEQSE